MKNNTLGALPKVELHCHLDGSLRPESCLEIGLEMGLIPSESTFQDVKSLLQAPRDCDSLEMYLKAFDLPISLMQSKAVIKRFAFELFEDAARESVRYLEVRFAPHLHTRKGLALSDVIESAIEGMRQAESLYPIKGNWILSHLRHHSVQKMFDLIEAGLPYLNTGVVAVDLAGAEPLGYAHAFVEPVTYAREKGFQITMHAGETGHWENVENAVRLLGATRIGHGCAIAKHPETADLVKSHDVVIEACPTSNLQTKIVDVPQNHPINQFYLADMCVMVNTDNRTVSSTTMTLEYELLQSAFGWKHDAFKTMYINGIKGAFCDSAIKDWLYSFIPAFDNVD